MLVKDFVKPLGAQHISIFDGGRNVLSKNGRVHFCADEIWLNIGHEYLYREVFSASFNKDNDGMYLTICLKEKGA